MKEIPLTRGLVALVDDEDYEVLSRTIWHVGGDGYAVRARHISDADGNPKIVKMHRIILGLVTGDPIVDHADRNRLNNQKINLRICSYTENMRNRGKQNNNGSGYKGVYWNKTASKWHAQIKAQGRVIYLGLFDDPAEAHQEYCRAAEKYHGVFANFS